MKEGMKSPPEKKVLEIFKPPFKYDPHGQMIWDSNNEMFLMLRGWGYLTGTGGLNLPDSEAAEIQDMLGEMIAKAMNEKYHVIP